MNCPSCSAPLLFGATSCDCGYRAASAAAANDPLEVSYWEGLRAYWRIYWPVQLLELAFVTTLAQSLLSITIYRVGVAPRSAPLPMPAWVYLLLFHLFLSAIGLFLFLPRLLSNPYRGFSLVAVTAGSRETTRYLDRRQIAHVWFFLWWRQLAAGLFATLLSAPLNVLLALLGLRISQAVAAAAGLFVIGPILVKMLVGYPFPAFSIEVRRGKPGRNS